MPARLDEPGLPFVDPTFDQDVFLAQSTAAFYTVKRAWAKLKADISRHVMGEDMWEAQKAEMEVFRLDGCHNILDGITVDQARMGEALTVGSDDRIVVHLAISGHDYVVRDVTGEVVRGDRNETSWREDWTMQRSRDPQLLADAASAKCPECGSPLTLDEDGACEFCHAVVPGAKTDWLVVDALRPTQAAEAPGTAAHDAVMQAMAEEAAVTPWLGSGPAQLPIESAAEAGIEAIKTHDPAFAPGDFLADCRALFIRLDESRSEMSPAMVRSVVADDFYAGEVVRAQQVASSGRNQVDAFLEVAGVSLLSAESADGRDRITVRVSATSAAHEIDVNRGQMVGGDNVIHPWHSDLTLERAATSVSDPFKSSAAGICPSCGAEVAVSADGRCPSCGEHVTNGEFGWVLVGEARRAD